MYGVPLGGDWGGLFDELVRVPWASQALVPLPEGLDPAVVASASDNLTDAWRAVGPRLRFDVEEAIAILRLGVDLADAREVLLEGLARAGAVDAMGGRRLLPLRLFLIRGHVLEDGRLEIG